MAERKAKRLGWVDWLLLALPFVGLLWVPFYARRTPEVFGLPFFYTYQFGWVIVSAGLTGIVYRRTRG